MKEKKKVKAPRFREKKGNDATDPAAQSQKGPKNRKSKHHHQEEGHAPPLRQEAKEAILRGPARKKKKRFIKHIEKGKAIGEKKPGHYQAARRKGRHRDFGPAVGEAKGGYLFSYPIGHDGRGKKGGRAAAADEGPERRRKPTAKSY